MDSPPNSPGTAEPVDLVLDQTQRIVFAAQHSLRKLQRRHHYHVRLLAKSQYCIRSSRQLLERLELARERWWFAPVDVDDRTTLTDPTTSAGDGTTGDKGHCSPSSANSMGADG